MMPTARRLLLPVACALSFAAADIRAADTAYITDRLTVTLRASPVNDAKAVGNPLFSGNPVDVLQRSPDGKWARVRFQQVEGWLPANLLQHEQAARDRLTELQARFDAIDREQKTGGSRLQDLEAEVQSLRTALAQAETDRDTALRQLGDLKLTAAGPQQLAASNSELHARSVELNVDNERLKAEVTRLTRTEESDFMLYGGLIVFGGVVIGWLLGRQPGRRSGW
ncbi:MAG: TIGR04211 family SH3 domain-containing protein [Pseudomonadota bacterium]